ncbi:jerky protein [Lasius niger]|uniref:Jerky protein n=1 Tax=Lasius niger TaxID=67767 RepID=A0A0J7KCI3_LASNI|nr:jerky protein [Lasius niger]
MELGEGGPSDMGCFQQQFIKRHGILLESENTTEILQNPVQRDDEANQSDPEKFIQEFSQRLEKENISTDNIYIMIKTDRIWELLFLTMKGYVDLTRVTIQVMDDYNKKIRKTPFIFCTNVTGSNKLPPFFGALENEYENQSVSEHCESKLRENVSTKESENFAWWYNNVFKKFVKYHQKEKNIIGKVLLLVDNCTRRILSEEITQDDRFEVLFLPKNRVSFFEQLYPDIMWYMEEEFRTYTLERSQNFSSEGKEFNINTHWITNVIYNSWVDVAYFLEKLWRRFLKQGRQTPEGTPILTSVSSQELINSTGRDIVPDEIPVMHISFAEVEKKERQEQEKNTEDTENTRESRKRRHSKISVVNSEEKINISEEDFIQITWDDIYNDLLSFDGKIEGQEL